MTDRDEPRLMPVPYPDVIETTHRGERVSDIWTRLLKDRIVFLGTEVNDDIANIIIAQLLILEGEDPDKEITLYINSPGGVITAGLAIYDTMQYIQCPVSTVCLGQAASMAAWLLAAGTTGGTVALSIGPTRAIASRFLPEPGEGPSEEAQEKGGFRIEFRSTLADGRVFGAEVIAKGDPGYAATSRMLGESGLCLATTDGPGGVLTPASAMGDALVERLREAGMTLRAWQVR